MTDTALRVLAASVLGPLFWGCVIWAWDALWRRYAPEMYARRIAKRERKLQRSHDFWHGIFQKGLRLLRIR